MTSWNPRANELFLKALGLGSAEERRKYLDDACAGDAALRARFGANARALVERKFSAEAIGKQTVALYDSLLKR